MQKRLLAIAAAFLVVITAAVSVSAAAARSVPVDKGAPLTADGVKGGIAGDLAALQQAMDDTSSVKYRILVVDGTEGEDRTAYLDRVAAQWGEPRANTLLLVLFEQDNWDIRFFMGADFRTAGVSVEEMLGMIREHYFARSRKGDPAGGLADLIRAVNPRMAKEKSAAQRQPFAWLSLQVGALPGTGSGMEWIREPSRGVEPTWTHSLKEARAFLGEEVLLPSSLDGKEIALYQEVDQQGNLIVRGAGLGSGLLGVRYRPAGDHSVTIRTTPDYTVTREQRLIGGRPALLLTYTAPKGRIRAELWIDAGQWIYEFNNHGDLEQLVKLAESML